MVKSLDLMKGKRGVILGVANNRSIAWGIARSVCFQSCRAA
jgi:enoyl-[acyl-carrier protein] reductase I